jgi:hypothetical protein
MDSRTNRIALISLTVALVLLLVVAVVIYPSGGPDSLPEPLEAVTPAPGGLVIAQTEIVVEIAIGYEVALVVDGIPIPSDEIYAVAATGTFRWRPQPGSVIEELAPGEHTVEVSWDRTGNDRPDPGAYSWTFRVT